MATNEPHRKPTETYIVAFHDVVVTIGMFCEVTGIPRNEFKGKSDRKEACSRMLEHLHKTYKTGQEFLQDLEKARAIVRAGWDTRKTEDTYGEDRYVQKMGRFEKSKVRTCLNCNATFISNNGLRRCGECRDNARRMFDFGGQYANARNFAHR